MAKIYGLFGSMTGKLADTVMSVRNGEQIARKYQPIVSNPSTPAQVAQRAKMKLMSQLSAVMAPVIAIPREGNVSSRNLFTRVNFPAATYAENQADITLTSVKLTKSVVALPPVSATREGSTGDLNISLGEVYNLGLSRVVYVAFAKQADDTLRFVGSVTSSTETGGFPAELGTGVTGEIVIYAYGVRDNNDAARAKFGDMQTVTAETVAKLIVTRTLTESDVTLTETKAVIVPAVA